MNHIQQMLLAPKATLTMVELKPCPFCGGKSALYFGKGKRPYKCYCTECETMSTARSFRTNEEAAAAWNTRSDDTRFALILSQLSDEGLDKWMAFGRELAAQQVLELA